MARKKKNVEEALQVVPETAAAPGVTVSDIVGMAKNFWVATGVNPTHVLLTLKQYNSVVTSFMATLSPKDKKELEKSPLEALSINPNTTLDVLIVAEEIGNTRKMEFPRVTCI